MPSITLIPNSYTNTGSYNFTQSTSYPITRAYANADHTDNYARLTLASNKNSSRTSTMYLEFGKSDLTNIPSSATIGTITANVRYGINNTTYVSAVSIQLHANTTAKGSAVTTRSTTSATSGGAKYSITPGSWTLSELQNIRLYISATHNKSTSSGYIYLYGADVTINYTVPTFTVTASSSASGVTIEPSSQTINQGDSASVRLNTNSNIIVKDNNVDVTSQLVQRTESSGDYTVNSVSGASYGFALSNGYYVSQNKGIDKSAALCRVNFYVPVAATITFTFINYAEQGYDFGVFGNIDTALSTAYYAAGSSGATITDTSYKLACNTSTYNSSSTKTLTYTMSSGNHFIDVKFSKDDGTSSNNDTLQFQISISLNEPFTPSTYYEYSISNVQTNHTIVVTSSGGGSNYTMYVKSGGTWHLVSKVYVKQNGSWSEASDILVKSGGSWH